MNEGQGAKYETKGNRGHIFPEYWRRRKDSQGAILILLQTGVEEEKLSGSMQ